MSAFSRNINNLSKYTEKLGICGNTGLINGTITGSILTYLNSVNPISVIDRNEYFIISTIITIFCWLIVLFILKFFIKLRIRNILLPSLINTILVCFLTVYLVYISRLYSIAWFIGLIVGITVGYGLCRLSKIKK
jgi:hypothetical protein